MFNDENDVCACHSCVQRRLKDKTGPVAPKQEESKPKMYLSTVMVMFPQQPPVALVFANGYKIGRFIESYKREGTPNEERYIKVQSGTDNIADLIFAAAINGIPYEINFASTIEESVNKAADELKKVISEIKQEGMQVVSL